MPDANAIVSEENQMCTQASYMCDLCLQMGVRVDVQELGSVGKLRKLSEEHTNKGTLLCRLISVLPLTAIGLLIKSVISMVLLKTATALRLFPTGLAVSMLATVLAIGIIKAPIVSLVLKFEVFLVRSIPLH